MTKQKRFSKIPPANFFPSWGGYVCVRKRIFPMQNLSRLPPRRRRRRRQRPTRHIFLVARFLAAFLPSFLFFRPVLFGTRRVGANEMGKNGNVRTAYPVNYILGKIKLFKPPELSWICASVVFVLKETSSQYFYESINIESVVIKFLVGMR